MICVAQASLLKRLYGEFPDIIKLVPLSELIENIVGGEWGKEEITGNYKNRIRCIRGTDIPNVQKSYYDDIPVRYVSRKHINEKSVKPNDIELFE